MVGDALNAANGVLKITDKLTDPKRYCTLTDAILKQIEVAEDQVRKKYNILIYDIILYVKITVYFLIV